MNENEVVELEIERRALLHTASEFAKDDGYMNTKTASLIDWCRNKAQSIQERIRAHFTGR